MTLIICSILVLVAFYATFMNVYIVKACVHTHTFEHSVAMLGGINLGSLIVVAINFNPALDHLMGYGHHPAQVAFVTVVSILYTGVVYCLYKNVRQDFDRMAHDSTPTCKDCEHADECTEGETCQHFDDTTTH